MYDRMAPCTMHLGPLGNVKRHLKYLLLNNSNKLLDDILIKIKPKNLRNFTCSCITILEINRRVKSYPRYFTLQPLLRGVAKRTQTKIRGETIQNVLTAEESASMLQIMPVILKE